MDFEGCGVEIPTGFSCFMAASPCKVVVAMFIVKLLVLPINRSRIAQIMWDWVELLNIHDV
jgi:hypothetical protein